MGEYLQQVWEPSDEFGLSRRDKAGGTYLAFIPDRLGSSGPQLGVRAFSRIADAQSAVTRADAIVGESGIYLNHLLLRSESIASSQIEGYQISPKTLAIADVTKHGSRNAATVLHNLRATEYAIDELARHWNIVLDDVVELHQAVAPHLARGVRSEQNWIDGAGNSPLRAKYVPPPHEQVVPLLEDLLLYLNETEHPPLLKAAIAHAQFETIHPFTDGNGRTGRALIHAILKRDGVTEHAVLPISAVFSTRTDAYVYGLTAFRRDAAGVDEWVEGFAEASTRAAQLVVELQHRARAVDGVLLERLHTSRTGHGLPPKPRSDSAVLKILSGLSAAPVLTIESASERFGVSASAAELALNELAEAGVLSRNKDHRGAVSAYASDEHLALVTLAERRALAGGQDTEAERPRVAPPLPEQNLRWVGR